MPTLNDKRKPKTSSRLIARLREISRGQTTPLGFARAPASKTPAMLLLAGLPATRTEVASAALAAGADGLVIDLAAGAAEEVAAQVRACVGLAGDKPVGAQLAAGDDWTVAAIDALANAGLDFVVISPSRAPAGLLMLESLGHIALVSGDLSEFPVRGLNEQHVDAMLLILERPDNSLPSLTVHDVATLRSALDAFRRPVVLPAPAGLTAADLTFVRESGAEALLFAVDAGARSEAVAARFAELRAEVDRLGPPVGRGRGTEGRQAILPSVRPADDEGDDDDDDDDG